MNNSAPLVTLKARMPASRLIMPELPAPALLVMVATVPVTELKFTSPPIINVAGVVGSFISVIALNARLQPLTVNVRVASTSRFGTLRLVPPLNVTGPENCALLVDESQDGM